MGLAPVFVSRMRRCVRVLRVSRGKAAMPEKGRLLVSRNSRDREGGPKKTAGSVSP